jgi:surface antigen
MAFVSSGQVQLSQPGEAVPTVDSPDIACPVCTTFKETPGQTAQVLPSRSRTSLLAIVKHPARAKSKPAASVATRVTTTTPAVQSRTTTPTPTTPPMPQSGTDGNVFPYGTCTWWADQRYFQLHGVYVPWHTQADAWQWTARAYQFGWHVSSTPVLGAIINLQPYVQGAYGLGHVAVVEKILSNGHVIASNMAWGANPQQVTYVEFAPGPGVTFLYQ